MSENTTEAIQPETRNVWAEPYTERRILAGFLREEDVQVVYPASCQWPQDIAAQVSRLHGYARTLEPRPEAGKCRVFPVEEPEALGVIQKAAGMLPVGPNMPVSYSWVELENLIVPASVADPIPPITTVFSSDAQSLAIYSLYGPTPLHTFGPEGALYSTDNVGFEFLNLGFEAGQIIYRYRIIRLPQPIVVGFENDRFYLLNGYGRVLQALIDKVEQLLCLVYYGLDLSEPYLGVELFNPQRRIQFFTPQSEPVNHFGRALLSGTKAPMVKDFLDPRLSVAVPARAELFMAMPSIQIHQVNLTPPPGGQLPLSINLEDDNS